MNKPQLTGEKNHIEGKAEPLNIMGKKVSLFYS